MQRPNINQKQNPHLENADIFAATRRHTLIVFLVAMLPLVLVLAWADRLNDESQNAPPSLPAVIGAISATPDPETPSKAAVASQVKPQKAPVVPESVKEAISTVCATSTLPDQCRKDLTAICLKESHCRPDALGKNTNGTTDGGAFQINSIHGFTDRLDPKAAAQWTLNRLVANGWPMYRTYALGAHHSKTPALRDSYAASVKLIADTL